MKGRLLMFLSIILLFSCKEENFKLTSDSDVFQSFAVICSGERKEAKIDKSNRTISIEGITNGNLISSVEYKLNDGLFIYPLPETFIGNWGAKESVQVSVLGGGELAYQIILPDFEQTSNLVKILLADKKQRIDFIGGDMERSQGFMQKCSNPKLVAKWCFGDVPFEVCRVSYDKQQEMEEGKPNMDFYKDAVQSMKDIREVNPDIEFWATMKSDYNGYGKVNNLPEWICDDRPNTFFNIDKYADFLADYLEYMYKNGVGIKYMSVAKEWTQTVTSKRSVEIIEKLNFLCEERGIPLPLYTDPSSWSIKQGVKYVDDINKLGKMELFYGFSTHDYEHTDAFESFVAECNKYDKKAYADETGSGFPGPTNGEEGTDFKHVISCYEDKIEFYKDGIQGEIMFELFSRGKDGETRGVYFKKGGEPRRMRAYYMYKDFAIGLAGKDKYYIEPNHNGVSEQIKSMSFSNDEKVFLVLLNTGNEYIKNIGVAVEGLNKNIESVTYSQYDIDKPIEGVRHENEKPFSEELFITDLTPMSISFITLSLKDKE